MIRSAQSGKSLPVFGNGQNVRDWLYVDDHARALVAVLERGRNGETYNIGGNSEQRNIDVVRAICSLMDEFCPKSVYRPHEKLIKFVTDRPGHDHRYAIDASKICHELDWRPTESFESGLRKTVQWYLRHEDWCNQTVKNIEKENVLA